VERIGSSERSDYLVSNCRIRWPGRVAEFVIIYVFTTKLQQVGGVDFSANIQLKGHSGAD